jgi:hypothetical protein
LAPDPYFLSTKRNRVAAFIKGSHPIIFIQEIRSQDHFRRHTQAIGKRLACLDPLE